MCKGGDAVTEYEKQQIGLVNWEVIRREVARYILVASDEPSAADADKRGTGAADKVIDAAIDRLGERKVGGDSAVSPQDQGKLQHALDKAKAPLGGRPGADQALGRAIKR